MVAGPDPHRPYHVVIDGAKQIRGHFHALPDRNVVGVAEMGDESVGDGCSGANRSGCVSTEYVSSGGDPLICSVSDDVAVGLGASIDGRA